MPVKWLALFEFGSNRDLHWAREESLSLIPYLAFVLATSQHSSILGVTITGSISESRFAFHDTYILGPDIGRCRCCSSLQTGKANAKISLGNFRMRKDTHLRTFDMRKTKIGVGRVIPCDLFYVHSWRTLDNEMFFECGRWSLNLRIYFSANPPLAQKISSRRGIFHVIQFIRSSRKWDPSWLSTCKIWSSPF